MIKVRFMIQASSEVVADSPAPIDGRATDNPSPSKATGIEATIAKVSSHPDVSRRRVDISGLILSIIQPWVPGRLRVVDVPLAHV
jgi:hypothetical protein